MLNSTYVILRGFSIVNFYFYYHLGYILRMESDVFHRDSKLSLSKIPEDFQHRGDDDVETNGYELMEPK